jgi:hydroxypyruvate reductase/glycerate 2-kinase
MSFLKELPGRWLVASMGTDGSDYMPDIAGAMADNNTLKSIAENSINIESYTRRYDSNTLFKVVGNSLIISGYTGTNVCDIMLYLLNKQD